MLNSILLLLRLIRQNKNKNKTRCNYISCFVHIQTLHPFSAMHQTSKTPSHRGRTVILGQLAPLTPRVISSRLAPISVQKPAFLPLRALLIPRTATKSLNLASESRTNHMNNHPNGFEVSLHLLQGKIHFRCFVNTSCLYRLTNVCNFFLGCWKARYHVTFLDLIQ